MIVTEVVEETEWDVTVKVAVVLPAATVTEAGTVAAAVLLDKETEIPPVGAAALKVTVPVAAVKLATLVGLIVIDDKATVDVDAVIVSVEVLLTPL